MGKAINVKVSTEKVIGALQNALDARRKKFDDYNKAEADYKKKMTDFEKSILKNISKAKVESVSTSHYYRGADENSVQISVVFPKGLVPVRPEFDGQEWKIKSEIEELENAIKLLKMTDESVVSTSTYSKVANYI